MTIDEFREKFMQTHKRQCYWDNNVSCRYDDDCSECEHQPEDDDKANGRNEPMLIEWEEEYDGHFSPRCPACEEIPHSWDRCFFCGQKLIKDERAEEWSKPLKVEYMDCFWCGGKNTVEFKRSRYNGHKHGHCIACGARFVE